MFQHKTDMEDTEEGIINKIIWQINTVITN